ncbi:ubiquinol-cytochrome C chaperone [Roseospira marina]|uniref:Ubiquinol-cytochrome C chaperone n=1 Tax=Roseospira marina TaxID=140057 RepID=A0A5M6II52_9PROT|nr:ubiquinol-cytochrome C chaperone family protein [Roseospira marina]KAA5607519.1 ubiquinol-cytochrome C chaperone [Roseospira marina]MBB4312296.1 cytochrome b pre-mRNA-processing protein 3 [Roseospira marina]MBB5085688.1 cytochrome b pre-mRNA-processing protein 3 [Roseospira marina]
MFDLLFGGRARARDRAQSQAVVQTLYGAVVQQTRRPEPYVAWGVPDTLDGRYDMLVLHAFVLFRALGRLSQEESKATGVPEGRTEAGGLSQAVFDHMLRDLDTNLREAGVSDMRIGARMKKLTKAFYGRVSSYEAGLKAEEDDATLRDALDRNVYQKVAAPPEGLAALARHVRALAAAADTWTWADLSHGVARYPDPEPTAEPATP